MVSAQRNKGTSVIAFTPTPQSDATPTPSPQTKKEGIQRTETCTISMYTF